MIVFTCAVCGTGHPGLAPEEAPVTDPEKLATLRSAWRTAYARRWRDGHRSSVPLSEDRYMQGRAALSWLRFAREHVAAGRFELAQACLETAGKHWERRKFLGSKAELERKDAAIEKAATAYLTASRRTGVWRVPETLVTANDGSLFLRCARPCKSPRWDGWRRGQAFYVILFFDEHGYYGHVKDTNLAGVKEKFAKRGAGKGIIACSLPFRGKWTDNMLDTSIPPDFREALSKLDRPTEDD
jgi:hypothetical protein